MAEQERSDEELQGLMGGLAKAEKSRRTRALIIAFVITGVLGGTGVLAVLFSDTFFQPELDIESGEKDVLAETNDPDCRGFIGKVTVIEADYRALEPSVAAMMKTEDPAELRKVRSVVASLRKRIDKQEVASQDATLRFDTSRKELDDWFDYIDNELSLVSDLAAYRLEQLGEPLELGEADAAGSPDAGEAGAGTPAEGAVNEEADAGAGEVVHVEAKPAGRPTGAARVKASSKTPTELHEGSMLAVHEAFQSFRVWHTGSLHPCGQAADGEDGWTPRGSTTKGSSPSEAGAAGKE